MREMDVKITNVFKRNFLSKATVVLNEGGARSSKSYSICQLFIYKFINEENKNFLISRKTLPSLRITAYKLFVDLLKEYKYYHRVDHNKTYREFKLNNNYLLATSLDEATKIQSTDFNYIWMEEAEEFTYDDYVTLKTRLSGKKKEDEKNQMFLTYNPKREFSYINKKVKLENDVELIKSTYRDNSTLSKDYINLLESLKEQSTDYYKIFTLGEYAQNIGTIFNNIRNIGSFENALKDAPDETIYGLDFGFNAQTALLKVDIKGGKYYLTELLYETKLTNADLIERLKDLISNKRQRIYCDTAEPARIQEIKSAGFNALESNKNVKDGIDFVKRCEIYTNDENVNLNKELDEYSYKKDRNGNLLDEPVKYNDHLVSGVRYSIFSNHKRKKTTHIRFL
jgi:phage terminase large subunit